MCYPYITIQFPYRVLIAYANGFIILWDITEDQAVLVSGRKDILLKDAIVVNSSDDVRHEPSEGTSDNNGQLEKDISSLCWVSSDGSVLAVGYVDGDILLWNLTNSASTKDLQSHKSLNNVSKLKLSSAQKRLPVIVLRWHSNSADKGPKGQLFVYGGDEIGSEEVLTVCRKCIQFYCLFFGNPLALKSSIVLYNYLKTAVDVGDYVSISCFGKLFLLTINF